jgi:hypothetical protein
MSCSIVISFSTDSLQKGVFLILILSFPFLVIAKVPLANAQSSEDLTTLAREVFSRIAQIYRSGGESHELVAKLNSALELIQQAESKRSQGDEANALKLREQARVEISEIMNDLPLAQQKAQSNLTTRSLIVFLQVPVIVALSTSIFYVGLKTWRWYEKTKLFEMRIVEKRKED